jgi:hypothetical protein
MFHWNTPSVLCGGLLENKERVPNKMMNFSVIIKHKLPVAEISQNLDTFIAHGTHSVTINVIH